jgi:uncharacterized protein
MDTKSTQFEFPILPQGFRTKAPTSRPVISPLTTMSNATKRLRMLLVDRVGERAYVFDPESADITLVSHSVAGALEAIQRGEQVSEEVQQALIELLNLEPVEDSAAGDGYSQWGITIHLNHACNLACEYCYADGRTSDFDGSAKGAYGGAITFVSPTVLEAGLEKFMRDAPIDNVLISFLGGEPLLSEERFLEAIRIIDEKAAKYGRHPSFQLTTNGTRNTEALLRCFKEHGFSIVISMDGDREMHNRQRPTASGTGSYDQVLRGAQEIAESGIRLGLRMTAIRGRPGIERAHQSLTSAPVEAVGFQFHIYGGDALRPLEGEERAGLFAHYRNTAHRILSGDLDAAKLVTVRDVLVDITTKNKKQYHCAAGRWSNTLTPNGDVYPCHRFVGMTGFKAGNVLDDSFRFAAQALFENNTVENRVIRDDGTQNCALCYAHNTCGGGCAQIAAANTGTVGELPPFFCQETRLRVQAVVRALVEKTHPDTVETIQ